MTSYIASYKLYDFQYTKYNIVTCMISHKCYKKGF